MANGLSNKEIADQLRKAEGTVKCQLKAIYSKLGIRSDRLGNKRVLAIREAEALDLL